MDFYAWQDYRISMQSQARGNLDEMRNSSNLVTWIVVTEIQQ